jgi:hypothetical protein
LYIHNYIGTGIKYFLSKFRNSVLRMEYLQDEVKKLQVANGEPVREVALALDAKTRWNSMIAMLESVFKVNFYNG